MRYRVALFLFAYSALVGCIEPFPEGATRPGAGGASASGGGQQGAGQTASGGQVGSAGQVGSGGQVGSAGQVGAAGQVGSGGQSSAAGCMTNCNSMFADVINTQSLQELLACLCTPGVCYEACPSSCADNINGFDGAICSQCNQIQGEDVCSAQAYAFSAYCQNDFRCAAYRQCYQNCPGTGN